MGIRISYVAYQPLRSLAVQSSMVRCLTDPFTPTRAVRGDLELLYQCDVSIFISNSNLASETLE